MLWGRMRQGNKNHAGVWFVKSAIAGVINVASANTGGKG